MKINLTIREATDVCTKHFKDQFQSELVSVEIENPPVSYSAPSIPLWEAVNLVRQYDFKNAGKIKAITALREWSKNYGSVIGLADAKMFVESIS